MSVAIHLPTKHKKLQFYCCHVFCSHSAVLPASSFYSTQGCVITDAGLLDWLGAGGLMLFNGLVGMAQQKSAIHQIYTTLNLGFGAQLVMMGFAMKEKN